MNLSRRKKDLAASTRTTLFLVALAWAASSGVHAQEQQRVPSAAIRTSVNMVLVDVVVTDKNDQPIKNLTADDFSVSEDGRQQKLTSFSFEKSDEISNALRGQRVPLPPNVTTNRPAYRMPASGPAVIILLDAVNTRTLEQSRARLELLKYLETQLAPRQQVAVYTLGGSLRLLQDFTDNPALLKAAIQGFRPTEPIAIQIEDIMSRLPAETGARPEQLHAAGNNYSVPTVLERLQIFLQEQANMVTDARVGITLTAFRQIAQSVAGLPGRKNLIWVTGSFPLATYSRIIQYSKDAINDPNYVRVENQYEDLVNQTASVLTDAQMAVYPVDARGLIGNLLSGAEDRGLTAAGTLKTGDEFGQDLQLSSRYLQATTATMEQLAGDTGGRVYINRNDLDHAVALSAQDGAAYYLLGYTPMGKADGKYHKIAVKVNRPGAVVRARQGYFASLPAGADSKLVKQRESQVALAIRLGVPLSTGVTFDARILPPAPAAKMKVGVDFLVDPSTLTAEAEGGNKRLMLEFHAVAYQSDGKIAGQRDVATRASLKPANFAALQQQGLPYHLELELPPGRYLVRLGVVDQPSGFIGTADLPLLLEGPR